MKLRENLSIAELIGAALQLVRIICLQGGNSGAALVGCNQREYKRKANYSWPKWLFLGSCGGILTRVSLFKKGKKSSFTYSYRSTESSISRKTVITRVGGRK